MHNRALILQHGPAGPPGLLAQWLRARRIGALLHASWKGHALPEPDGFAFVASLGSNRSPRDRDDPMVAAELDLLERAVARNVPVLGLCFGGQALATVLGGSVEAAPAPEVGWYEIARDTPDAIPTGPWLQWHYERFTVPPGARELARSPVGPQAFRHGRHLGVQFHPESTIDVVAEWARQDGERLAAHGIDDGPRRVEAGRRHAAAARQAAFRLFDAFWRGTGAAGRAPSARAPRARPARS